GREEGGAKRGRARAVGRGLLLHGKDFRRRPWHCQGARHPRMTAPLPVLLGAGQFTDRPDDPRDGLEPLALMETAARRACDDAHAGRALLDAIDTVAVVTNVFHDYGDTARMLAGRLRIHPARTIRSTWGGNTPQSLLSHLCDEIAAGRIEVALLAGGEAVQTMRALGKAGTPSPWTPASAIAVPRWGDTRPGVTEAESR